VRLNILHLSERRDTGHGWNSWGSCVDSQPQRRRGNLWIATRHRPLVGVRSPLSTNTSRPNARCYYLEHIHRLLRSVLVEDQRNCDSSTRVGAVISPPLGKPQWGSA
jgi:hypothetical protein